MLNVLIVGLGGFLGTILRFVMNQLIYKGLGAPLYPYGTLAINVLGCFLIGMLGCLAETRVSMTPSLRLFFQIGILGGFTTFSTFGYETFALIRDGQFVLGIGNIILQVLLGLAAVWLGYYLAQLM